MATARSPFEDQVTIGEEPIAPALEGPWPYAGFPEQVQIMGRPFRRAQWRQPYEGVVEQYREDRPGHSMHLKVLSDGRWIVDHFDDHNPDSGSPVDHFLSDHPAGKFMKAVAPYVAVIGIGAVIRRLTRA